MATRKRQRSPGGRQAPDPGRRPSRTRPLLVAGAVVALFLVAGLLLVRRVGPEERAYATRSGASARRLDPGWHLVLPGGGGIVRLPAAPLEVSGRVDVRSREGIDLTIPFTIAAAAGEAAPAALIEAVRRSGSAAEALRRPAIDRLSKAGADASAEDLVLAGLGGDAAGALRAALEADGWSEVSVTIGRPEGPPGVLASIASRALRDRMTDTGRKVALFGLDAADWEIMEPMLRRGELPTLARLRESGAWGNMKSMDPMLSPLLWTTVATGRTPDQHGIVDFLIRDAGTGRTLPVGSRWRKTKALWNIFDDAGRTSAFVAWWATWPAEPVNGYTVSDRVAYSLFGYEAEGADLQGATFPPGYFKEIRPLIVDDDDIPYAEVRRFAHVDAETFRATRARLKDPDDKGAFREPLNHLARILASARTYQAIGLDILRRGQPDLFSLYYQGIDEVCHGFAHEMPPRMEMVTDEEYARYHDTVFAYYRHQDRLLGEMLARLDPDTNVIVLSDHGFKNGGGRPRDEPPFIEGKPGLWHRRYGILILAGPDIRRVRLDTSSLLDVAPTVLYLAGLPVPSDMSGRVLKEAIAPGFSARVPLQTIASYEGIGRPLHQGEEVTADAGVDEAMLQNLRNLGYIGDVGGPAGAAGGTPGGAGAPAGGAAVRVGGEGAPGPAGAGAGEQTLVTGYLNEASLHLKNKDYARAEELAGKALQSSPDWVPALILMAQIRAEQKRPDEAIRTARRVLEIAPEDEPQVYGRLVKLYADAGRIDEGIRYLRQMARDHSDVAQIHAALGALLLRQGKTPEAEEILLKALRMDPSLGEPLTELHTIYSGSPRMLSLEPLVREGLRMNDQSVVHHNWLGLIHEWKKDLTGAEREFRRAMELDPDYAATMANLGALYGRSGRLPEAVTVLTRAVGKDPENMEAWVNLGAAQGRMGHAREAIEALETARRKGARSTTLYNALALAYLQNRQRDKALEFLKESLRIDPDQKDAQELLKVVSQMS